jgi:glycerol-3-phosphate cytidylyltransferase
MFEVGYTTGTFDLIHSGHYELLKRCKTYCKILIVGLVTDELGVKQKRKPVLSFEHRKTILENSKYVDHVVHFSGSSKQEDYRKLKFDVLFISDEYMNETEYTSFEKDVPKVPVYYFPRSVGISTSEIYKELVSEVISNASIYKSGTGDNILSFPYKNTKSIVVKSIDVSNREYGNTCNNFGMDPNNLPRNWKLLSSYTKTSFPNISSVNPTREIEIFKFLKDKPWYPVIGIKVKRTDFSTHRVFDQNDIINDVSLLNKERKLGQYCYWVLQEDCGKTLRQMFNRCNHQIVYTAIWNIINDMKMNGIIHMDLHADNVLVDHNNNVYIIDFGWCLHRSFQLTDVELQNYNSLLELNFDRKHFGESLVTMGLEKTVPSLFK